MKSVQIRTRNKSVFEHFPRSFISSYENYVDDIGYTL